MLWQWDIASVGQYTGEAVCTDNDNRYHCSCCYTVELVK